MLHVSDLRPFVFSFNFPFFQKGDADVDSDAGGEDDDFGDEVRSDDEEEVGNDDANEGGGTLHQVCQ